MKPDLIRRQEALEKTQRKYRGKPCILGKYDCVLMLRSHLVAMGHKGLPRPGKYSDAKGAKRELVKQGAKTLEELVDQWLARIPPAAMLPGDVALVPSEPDETSVGGGTIVIGAGHKFLGWHPDAETLAVIEPLRPPSAAWRA